MVVIRCAFDDRAGYPQIGLCLAVAVDVGGFTVAINAVDNSTFAQLTDDARLRAFDARSGQTLWTWKLEASAHATPITYLGRDGRQYIAIVATGGSFLDSPIDSDALTVFALP